MRKNITDVRFYIKVLSNIQTNITPLEIMICFSRRGIQQEVQKQYFHVKHFWSKTNKRIELNRSRTYLK